VIRPATGWYDAGAMRRIALAAGLGLLLLTLLLPEPAGLSRAGWVTLGLLAMMALWWFTEALPVIATALVPFVVLPLVDAMPLNAVAASYMSPIIFLVLGGALLALAMEKWGLHRRVALAIVLRAGTVPRRLVLAFMVATAFISMWVSNTSTALIMIPIATALLSGALPRRDAWTAAEEDFGRALVLGIAYSASIGGLGTLVGSPTNAIAAALIDRTLGVRIEFLDWLAFGIPLVLVSVPATWWLLTHVSFKVPAAPLDRDGVLAAVGRSGPLSPAERRLLPLLAATAAAWLAMPLLRELPGLARLDDSIVAIAAALALFLVPADPRARGGLLDWPDTARVPWDVLFLFGGGLALAEAITRTGLGQWLGMQLGVVQSWPLPLVMLAVTLLIVFVTEFASNVAAASSFVPVVALAVGTMQVDPLWLAMPAALACSWGFMMPAGTPPNAIAYATGQVSVPRMVRAGFWVDLLGLLAIPLAVAAGMALRGAP
jgi:sodium-dependent dicarboxylate transporter 2/3/5